MGKLLVAGIRILVLGIGAYIVCLIKWPFWTLGISVAAYLYIRCAKQMEADRIRLLDFKTLSPIEYEHYCAKLLSDAGWTVKTTPVNDQGVDVLAALRGTSAAIQCKKYTQAVGNAAVQEVISGRRFYSTQVAVVVSPVRYTRSARQLAERCGVLLIHHDQLKNLAVMAKVP